MFIEAIDKLRCVRDHEDSWLVAKFVEMQDRYFQEGELGCPVCEARYPVRNGIVYFSPMQPRAARGAMAGDSPDDLFALAAMLDLSAPDRTVVLCDGWTCFAPALSKISEPHVFVVNADAGYGPSECIYEVVSTAGIPLAPASVDAVALDAGASRELVQSAVRVLREGGRLVGASGLAVPPEVLLLASDEKQWVARKQADFIPLRRASR
jgi:hypothetical protein